MQPLTIYEIIKATGGKPLQEIKEDIPITDITTDSRKAADGCLFIPLIGENMDGHNFIGSAISRGATACLTQNDAENTDAPMIKVSDTRKALGDIARFYKEKYYVPSVGITGSVGKTTTKDLVYSVLARHYNAHKTQRNFNNDIGVPQTIFGIEREHNMAVIEMGMNHFGEIEYLAGIAKPDIAIITNVGMSHIENLGSREGILKAKLEITKNFTEKNTLYINGDNDLLKTVKDTPYNVKTFGTGSSNDVYAKDIVTHGLDGVGFTVVYDKGEFRAEVLAPGAHNVYNALAAVCAGLHFGVSKEECIEGLKSCKYTDGRLEIIRHNGMEIISDCYNSSPDSIRAAVKVQKFTDAPKRVAVLGDVLEMGDYAPKAHYDVGADIAKEGLDLLITAGANARHIAKGAADAGMRNIKSYDTTEQAAQYLPTLVGEGDSILIKASHGMKFDKLVDELTKM